MGLIHEYEVFLCVADFCNKYSISICNLPDGYKSILAHNVNQRVYNMMANIMVLTKSNECDLELIIQEPPLILEYKTLCIKEHELEVAMIMVL